MSRELDPKNPKPPVEDGEIEIISGIYDEMLEGLEHSDNPKPPIAPETKKEEKKSGLPSESR